MPSSLQTQKLEKHFYRLLLQALLILNDPFLQKVNVTYLKISQNLHRCQIFYTFFGNLDQKLIITKLATKVSLIKKNMIHHWKYHHFPQLVFVYDQSILNAEKITTILKDIKDHD